MKTNYQQLRISVQYRNDVCLEHHMFHHAFLWGAETRKYCLTLCLSFLSQWNSVIFFFGPHFPAALWDSCEGNKPVKMHVAYCDTVCVLVYLTCLCWASERSTSSKTAQHSTFPFYSVLLFPCNNSCNNSWHFWRANCLLRSKHCVGPLQAGSHLISR